MKKVSRVKVSKNLKSSILKVVNQIGGFKSFISSSDKVLLKPNFNTADPFPASTDPEFLKIVIELILESGVGEIIVADSCTFSLKTRKVMDKLGIFELEKIDKKVKVIPLNEKEWMKKRIPDAKFLKTASIPKIISQVDKLIFLPCLKTHWVAQFTGSLKLSVGLLKIKERFSLHSRYLQKKIGELNKLFNPDLIILDARKCFINKGPSEGETKEPNLILASTSRVAIDIEGVKIIQSYKGNSLEGIEPEELPQIKRAIEVGL